MEVIPPPPPKKGGEKDTIFKSFIVFTEIPSGLFSSTQTFTYSKGLQALNLSEAYQGEPRLYPLAVQSL